MYDDNISFYILYVDNVFIADYRAVLFFKFCTLQYKTLNAPLPPQKKYHVILVFSLSYCIVFFLM